MTGSKVYEGAETEPKQLNVLTSSIQLNSYSKAEVKKVDFIYLKFNDSMSENHFKIQMSLQQ